MKELSIEEKAKRYDEAIERPNGNLCPLRKEFMVGGPGYIIGNIHDNPELLKK